MRSIPMLLRMADEMKRITSLPPRLFFYDEPPLPLMRRWPAWMQLNRLEADEVDFTKVKDGKYELSLDVSSYKPDELKVKVIDNDLIVEGKHEERQDEQNGGFISRHFVRRYSLPKEEGYEVDKVSSTLSSDGILTVSLPKLKQLADAADAREIPIQKIESSAASAEQPAVEAKNESSHKEK